MNFREPQPEKKPPTEIARTDDAQAIAPITRTIGAVSFQELSITTPDGEPATLAVIDMQGRIIDSGPTVMRAVWDVALRSYRNFLIGNGHFAFCRNPSGLTNRNRTH
ncbi:hypothetical protein ACEPUD_32380 [Burkholderia ubonensis]|uniref:hypothetical protein n=1 Tax=Burkholderia ubonensis TaxID=101571 RepID=UPI00358DEA9A